MADAPPATPVSLIPPEEKARREADLRVWAEHAERVRDLAAVRTRHRE